MTQSLGNRDKWAYDIDPNVVSKGEAFDEAVINISIENILSTYYGERIHNPYFGCELPATIFENLLEIGGAEAVLENIIESIETWEDRIIILKDIIKMTILRDDNALELRIPYVIKQTAIESSFEKRIIF